MNKRCKFSEFSLFVRKASSSLELQKKDRIQQSSLCDLWAILLGPVWVRGLLYFNGVSVTYFASGFKGLNWEVNIQWDYGPRNSSDTIPPIVQENCLSKIRQIHTEIPSKHYCIPKVQWQSYRQRGTTRTAAYRTEQKCGQGGNPPLPYLQ